MSLLRLAIAHQVGGKMQFLGNHVRQMQIVGLVRQAHILRHGNNHFVELTFPQLLLAPLKLKLKRLLAQQIAQAQLLKPTPRLALLTRGQDGLQRVTLAWLIQQLVSQAQKLKQQAVQSTTQVDTQAQEQALVQRHIAIQYGEHGKQVAVAHKTHQRAK